jgi:hypothetical protein
MLTQSAILPETANEQSAVEPRSWSVYELEDLKAATRSGYVVRHIAVYLSRTLQEVRSKAAEIGLKLNE